MSSVLYAVEIAFALGMVIFVHELGHFLSAKAFGVWVRRFAIGFGPILLKWQRGETEYSLRALPLGGFVEPMGDHPDSEGGDDPRALWRLPAWQRAVVFAAGVGMNCVLALVLFVIAPMVGIKVPVPVVGGVVPNLPADKAGFRPGDRLVSINGEKVQSFEDVIWTVALSKAGDSFELGVERPVAGTDVPHRLTITTTSRRVPGAPAPMLGIEPERETLISKLHASSLLSLAGFQEGDRVLAVNGQPIETWRALDEALGDAPAGPLTIRIEREGNAQDLRVVPADLNVYDFGMRWPTEIVSVEAGSPAEKSGLKVGDRVAAVGDSPWPTEETFINTIKEAGADTVVPITLWRNGELVNVECRPALLPGEERPRVGIGIGDALAEPILVGQVDAGGAAEKAGLRPGDTVSRAGDPAIEPSDWQSLMEVLLAAKGQPVTLQVKRGGNDVTTTLEPHATPQERLTLAGAMSLPLYVPLPRIYNPLMAAKRGVKRTFMWFGRVYLNMRQLVTGEVSTKAVGGPVAIVQWSYSIASYGMGTFMDFWGMLSIFIAVLNFLPVPPFDGGHVVFVLIEAIRGSPVSVKVRNWVWGAGWAAVGLLFVLVMWQDVGRLF